MAPDLIQKCRDRFELANGLSDPRHRLDQFLEALDILEIIRTEGSPSERIHADALAKKYANVIIGWLPSLSRIDESLWKSYVGAIFFGLADEMDSVFLENSRAETKWKHFFQLYPVSSNELRKQYKAWL